MTWIFLPEKLHRKKYGTNQVDFSTIQTTLKKVSGDNVNFSAIEITSKTVRVNNVDFSTIEITSKKVPGNNVDFSTSEITLKKVLGNYVNFPISKITPKKYVEMTWKFVEIWSLTYRRDTDIKSTSARRGVPVGIVSSYFFCDKFDIFMFSHIFNRFSKNCIFHQLKKIFFCFFS